MSVVGHYSRSQRTTTVPHKTYCFLHLFQSNIFFVLVSDLKQPPVVLHIMKYITKHMVALRLAL